MPVTDLHTRKGKKMNTQEIIGWLNHSLTLEWNQQVAEARDLLEKQLIEVSA